MKKRITFLLLLAALFALLSASALAEDAAGRGALVAQGDGLAAYVDGEGNLLIPGNNAAVNQLPADAIISIDSYRLIFLSKSETDAGETANALVCLDLSTFEENVVADNVAAACMVGTDLYFVPADDRTQLMKADFEDDMISVAYTSPDGQEAFDRLFLSADGLVATYADGAGAVTYVEATDSFEPFTGSLPTKSVLSDGAQIYLADGSTLFLLQPDAFAADAIDTNVYDFTLLDGKIYYLANTGSAIRLKVYDPQTMEQRVLTTPEISLDSQITASAARLFVLGTDQKVYSVDLESGALSEFLAIQAPASDSGAAPDSYDIEAMSGLLTVYATYSESEAPAFTFIEFTSEAPAESTTRTVLVQSVALDGEETAWTLLQPAEQYAPLSRGSRGDAVSAIQQPLYDLGYYDYYIDGIFGWRTENAIRLLQFDLDLPVNGIADEDLQRLILSGTLSPYDPYLQLDRGDRGLRVTTMQQRLRDLGYLADDADGIFGVRTQTAVQLFQRENGLAVSDSATRDTLIALYAAGAPHCSSYIDLRQGDSGYRVRQLNQRLKDLYYLDGSVGDSYTSATAQAVRRFQAQVGLVINGEASATVQQRLFSASAPEYNGYITLRRGDESQRVARLQRRLKELNYFTANVTGYFGSQTQAAVQLFQQTVGMRPTGVATVEMQQLLFSPYAPVYVKPTIIGTPVIGIDCYETRVGGVYYLTERCSATGNVIFSWSAAGDVDRYNIRITDNTGAVLVDADTHTLRIGVPIASLAADRIYTLQVTAYPADGNAAHITSATLSFARMETPPEPPAVGTITNVVSTIETVSRLNEGVFYVYPGTVTLRWYAEGDLESYYVEIRDANGNTALGQETNNEFASFSSDLLREGMTYTFYVYAIPTNGTMDDAASKALKFALDDQLEPIAPVEPPVITVDGMEPDGEGIYTLDENATTFRWNAVENAAQYYIEIRDAADAYFSSETTTATGYVLNPSSMTPGASYTLYVTAIPEGGTVEQGATASVRLRIREDETVEQLAAPVLSIVGAEPSSDRIAYVDGPALTFQWTAVEGAGAYNVVIRDSSSVLFETTVAELTYTFDASALSRGTLYTALVTAIPPEGVLAQGTPASQSFILRPEEVQPTATPAPENTPEPTPEAVEPTETQAAAPLGVPQLSIGEVDETVDGVTYVLPGVVTFQWTCEGDPAQYAVEVTDASGAICASTTTELESLSLHSDVLVPDQIYTLHVTALPASREAEDGASSELRFAIHAAEPAAEPTAEPTEAPVTEATETEAPATEATPIPEATEAPVEPIEPTAEPAVEPTEAPVAPVAAPVIDIQPALESVDGVTYVGEGVLTISWYAEGAASYRVAILQDGNLFSEADVANAEGSLDTSVMAPGAIYTLRVTAIPEGGTAEDGATSEANFSLAVQATEPTEVPAPVEEPTPEPAEPEAEPVVEPEPTVEPTVEPTIEPVAEPTVEPTAEPEPTEAPVAPVAAPVIDIQPVLENVDGVAYVGEGIVSMSWYSEGAANYRVTILDGGNVVSDAEVQQQTGGSLDTSVMTPGVVYTLRVTAIPEGGTAEDGATSEMAFCLAIQATPEPTLEPTPVPTEVPTPEPTLEPTPVPTEVPTPEPTLEPTPVPTEVPTPEPTMEPTPEPAATIPQEQWQVPLDANSDPTLISAVQARLVEWGWLQFGSYTDGMLDDATLSAVAAFQNDYNANNGGALVLVTPEARVIGADTLMVLMNANGQIYLNPNAAY